MIRVLVARKRTKVSSVVIFFCCVPLLLFFFLFALAVYPTVDKRIGEHRSDNEDARNRMRQIRT